MSDQKVSWRWPWLAAPVVGHLAIMAVYSRMNWPFRYSMPVLPYLFVASSVLVRVRPNRLAAPALALLLVVNMVEVAVARPDYLSHGNRLAGGPMGAQRMFLGSDYDWGQDLLRLKSWADSRADRSPLIVSHFGVEDLDFVGIRADEFPPALVRGGRADSRLNGFWWAISSNCINGFSFDIGEGDRGARRFGVVESTALKPEGAQIRLGSILIYKIASGGEVQSGTIPLDALRGCIREVGDDESYVSP